MTESKIRTLLFAAGATAVWLLFAYMVALGELSVRRIAGLILIGLFLTIVSMGQGER